MLRVTILCLAALAVVLAAPGDSVWDDANGDTVTYCPAPGQDNWGYNGRFRSCAMTPDSSPDPSTHTRYAKPVGGERTAPALAFEYNEESVNDARGTGFRVQLEYVAEVGPSDLTVIKKIFGTPTCQGDPFPGDLEPIYDSRGNWLPWGCGTQDHPWGNNESPGSDEFERCAERMVNNDHRWSFSGAAVTTANVTMCEEDAWTEFGQSWALFGRNEESFDNHNRGVESADQATARIEKKDIHREELARADLVSAVYDWPLANTANRYNFRYRIERANMDGPEGVGNCEDMNEDSEHNSECLLLRGEPKGDGFKCDGPPVDGPGGDSCGADPQLRMTVRQKDGASGAYPQLDGWAVSWLYGDAAVRHTSYGYGGNDMYNSAACDCDTTTTAALAETNLQPDGSDPNVWYLDYVVPATPDCPGSCWHSGTNYPRTSPRGVMVRPMFLTFDAGVSTAASALLVALAALFAFIMA